MLHRQLGKDRGESRTAAILIRKTRNFGLDFELRAFPSWFPGFQIQSSDKFCSMSTPSDSQRMEKIVSLCKRRGFIFQSSEIYGGLNGAWDYGPLGVELKRNLKNYWWHVMVHERDDVVGMDGAILTHPAVLKAIWPVEGFSDPMIDCRTCKAHLRADQLVEKKGIKQCPNCGGKDLTEARQFNLMFETHVGASAEGKLGRISAA